MAFNRNDVSKLLAKCHRRCCICHRFCGVKMETDHIEQRADGGNDNIDNAIPVCFECHAEIHSYNEKHPRGRKFTHEELKQHKKQWLEICQNQPEVLVKTFMRSDVGPLQSLIDELEFNQKVAELTELKEIGCIFHDYQFKRAIQLGSVATLKDELKKSIIDAYVSMGKANQHISMALNPKEKWAKSSNLTIAQGPIRAAKRHIEKAIKDLFKFLGTEDNE